MRKKILVDDKYVSKVCKLYEEGNSILKIASLLGLTEMVVRKRLLVGGIKRRPVGGTKLKGYVSSTELMKHLGRAHHIVKRIIAEAGIETLEIGRRVWIKEEDVDTAKKLIEDKYRLSCASWKDVGIAEWEMGWLGGIVDGEGHIQVHATADGKYVTSDMNVTNSCEAVLRKTELLLEKLGIKTTRKQSGRSCYRVGAKSFIDQWKFAKTVYPFLVLKKRDADILISMCEERARSQGRRYGTVRVLGVALHKNMLMCREDRDRGTINNQ